MKHGKIAFLGTGNMGAALIEGALVSGMVNASEICAFDADSGKLSTLSQKTKIATAKTALEAVQNASYVFLCVKPQQMKGLIAEVRASALPSQHFISIAAGLSTGVLEGWFEKDIPVIRAMPNTPAMVQRGMTALAAGRHAEKNGLDFAVKFFGSVGLAVVLDEKDFDAVTAVSGSGPAYVFYLTEVLEKAACELGLDPRTAEMLARQTVMGSGQMLFSGAEPAELRRRVTSPGGTTEAALKVLEQEKWAEVFMKAVKRAQGRSRELQSMQTKAS